jgi:acetylornithine deacetylase
MSALPSTPVELLAQLVAVESVNPDFGGPADGQIRLAELIERLAKAWALQTQRLPVGDAGLFNLLVSAPPIAGREWIVFESHLDTVSIDGMSVPPLQLTQQHGRLFGRGACDTKGTGAGMLWALKEFAASRDRSQNAAVLFAVDEEAGMSGAQAFARHLDLVQPLRGIVVGEPTQMKLVVAHNGALRWRTVTRGVAAHSADPSKGRSAIAAMMEVIARLERDFIPRATATHALTGRAAASINVIRGGNAVNIIPDHCEIHCDRRLVPGETVADVLAQRDAALRGLDVEHDRQYLAPPLPPETSARFAESLAPVFARFSLSSQGVGVPYATDASHYASVGAPVVVFGPGSIAQAHTRDEWIDRAEFEKAVSVYAAILAAR